MKRQTRLALLCLAGIVGQVATSIGQAVDMASYGVAYVEVLPSTSAQLISAFRQYRDASRQENGYVRFELLEQIGRPGHFSVIETWRDQAAFDAHQKAASASQLRDALQPIRLSGYDQRPYKTLAVGSPAADRGAIAIVTHVDIGGGSQLDAPALLRRFAETSRMERGCLRFDVLQHSVRGNHFTILEAWESQEALDRHVRAAHTRQYRDELQPVTGSPLDERLYRAVE